jgi:hypothetical protein
VMFPYLRRYNGFESADQISPGKRMGLTYVT